MKRIMLFFIAIGTILLADDNEIMKFSSGLIEAYRKGGMGSIENRLDQRLREPSHWRLVLRKHDTTYGFFEEMVDLLWCDKSQKRLTLFHANGLVTQIASAPIVLGKVPGDKWEEGDGKTPLGVYHIIDRKTHLDPKYGPLALVTNYPNRYDRIWGKNGHGIWLHGMPPNCEKNATRGCVAVDNSHLIALDRSLRPSKTLLVISDDSLVRPNQETLAHLLAFLYDWRYAWKYNQFDAYIAKYSPELVFKEKYNLDYFKRYKKRVFEKYKGIKKVLRINQLQVVPYPNSFKKRLWYVTFHELFMVPTYRFDGRKELLIEELPNRRFAIIVE